MDALFVPSVDLEDATCLADRISSFLRLGDRAALSTTSSQWALIIYVSADDAGASRPYTSQGTGPNGTSSLDPNRPQEPAATSVPVPGQADAPKTNWTVTASAPWDFNVDIFQYAKKAEDLARPARESRQLPLCRWLRPGERRLETIALASYPRSGNSMLRGLLERAYGV